MYFTISVPRVNKCKVGGETIWVEKLVLLKLCNKLCELGSFEDSNSCGHSHLLSSFLGRLKQKENTSLSACKHFPLDLSHLHQSSASEPLQHAIVGTTSIFDVWFRP